MASIRNFKKELMYTYGALLDQCYIIEMIRPSADKTALGALCGQIEEAYMQKIDKATARKAGKSKADYFKGLRVEFEASVETFVEKINALAK